MIFETFKKLDKFFLLKGFPSMLKRGASVKFFRLEERFEKLSFLWRIISVGKPNLAGEIKLSFQILDGILACKQALRMGYSEICFRIARGRARESPPPP